MTNEHPHQPTLLDAAPAPQLTVDTVAAMTFEELMALDRTGMSDDDRDLVGAAMLRCF